MDILVMHSRLIAALLFGFLCTFSVYAEQNVNTDSANAGNSGEQNLIRPQVASIVSSPRRCELSSGNTVCQMTMSLIWEAPKADSYCIWHQGQSQPIKCWENTWQGNLRLKFKSSQKVSFVLKANGDDIELAKVDVAVTASYKQRKRAQRRKRGFWRMF